MRLLPSLTRWLSLPLLVLAVGSCTDTARVTGLRPTAGARDLAAGPRLVECPSPTSASTTGTIGLLGGLLGLDGHLIDVPLGAVPVLERFEVHVPASRYLEVDFRVSGVLSYLFSRPATITLDYSRCPREVTDGAPLHIYYIDPETKAILQDLGGTNDPANRRITTTTDHLSDYALGVP